MIRRSKVMDKDRLTVRQLHRRNKLVKEHLPLAYYWAWRIYSTRGRAYPFANLEDMRQECVLGLMTACERWDVARGVKMSFWLAVYIKQRAHDWLTSGGLVRVPVTAQREVPQEELTRLHALSNPSHSDEAKQRSMQDERHAAPSGVAEDVAAAVAELPPTYRRMAEDAWWGGISWGGIGKALGCTRERGRQLGNKVKELLADRLASYKYTDALEG